MANRYILKTLGCKANLYDSQLIEQELQARGWEPSLASQASQKEQGIDLCIVNSCTVTDEADKQTRKMLTRLSRENPNAVVVVTGCGAEVNPKQFSQLPEVNFVVGNQDKNELVNLISKKSVSAITSDIHKQKILGPEKPPTPIQSKHINKWSPPSDTFRTPPTKLTGFAAKTRSFLKIQEGCDSFCTYCIIPYGRGPSRSLRPREVIEQIKSLVAQGIQEVILTGTNIGDYGKDWGSAPALGDLLELILTETSLLRLRISSLDPTEITLDIFSLMEKNPRICPHFHVSLQSPHHRILKLMKRKYGFDEVKGCLEKIAQISARFPSSTGGVFVGMDIITGFPGESEEEFNWTYETLSALPWSRLHVFPYSERMGTPATRLPNPVPRHIRFERSRKLSELSLTRLVSHYQSILDTCKSQHLTLNSVLVERVGDGSQEKQWISGYTPHYIRTLISPSTSLRQNQIIAVEPLEIMIDSKNNDVALVSKMQIC